MTTIAFASWKGGTGKTTLAFNTAERANADGVRTLLCDFDPQATALRQHQLRQSHSPDRTRVTTVKASMSDEGIAALQGVQGKDSYDLIICDMPGESPPLRRQCPTKASLHCRESRGRTATI